MLYLKKDFFAICLYYINLLYFKHERRNVMNQVILVGRLCQDPELLSVKNQKQMTSITLAINRHFKNNDGIYETDFIRCVLWNGIAANTTEYCHKGDIVGVKGRLQTSVYEDDDNNKKYGMDVVAEKITFLSSGNKKEELNQDNSSS